jgi:hypothetical protein
VVYAELAHIELLLLRMGANLGITDPVGIRDEEKIRAKPRNRSVNPLPGDLVHISQALFDLLRYVRAKILHPLRDGRRN